MEEANNRKVVDRANRLLRNTKKTETREILKIVIRVFGNAPTGLNVKASSNAAY